MIKKFFDYPMLAFALSVVVLPGIIFVSLYYLIDIDALLSMVAGAFIFLLDIFLMVYLFRLLFRRVPLEKFTKGKSAALYLLILPGKFIGIGLLLYVALLHFQLSAIYLAIGAAAALLHVCLLGYIYHLKGLHTA